ncbi:MAG: type II secretion system F family protein [Sphingobium sp.]|nr:type II secretion system F family protein [Sphingobium sp.]
MALAGLLFAVRSVHMLRADHRLTVRLAARGVPMIRQKRAGPPLPALFAPRGRDRMEIESRLRQAGFEGAHAIDRFVWIRLGATFVMAVLLLMLSRLVWGAFFAKPLLVLTGAGLTFIAAKLLLNFVAQNRALQITAEFPFLLDMMLMMLESGMSLDQCFRSIAKEESRAAPRHCELIALLVADLDRGMSYEVGLERWATRVGVSGAKELATLFRQGLFQGVQLTPALRDFIEEFTERRIAGAREAMGKIAVRMVVVMIVFFMPALFIVLGGPPVTTLFDTLRGMRQ